MSIRSITFPNVRTKSLGSAWTLDEGFTTFRGSAWMQEPCVSCDRKSQDFGGCRCQAYALTGDAANTDPACSLAPTHGLIEDLVRRDGKPRPMLPAKKPIVLRNHRGPSRV